ncbi:unnamed protein product, partial [Ectocarpus fasciculatus]
RGPLLDRDEFRIISSFWPEYFPDEGADGAPESDPRLFAAGAFRDFFLAGASDDGGEHPQHPGGSSLLEGCDLETCSSVRLDYHLFLEAVPMPDFAKELQVGSRGFA